MLRSDDVWMLTLTARHRGKEVRATRGAALVVCVCVCVCSVRAEDLARHAPLAAR